MIIGIHLGANYTRVAFIKDGLPQMLREIDIPRDGNAGFYLDHYVPQINISLKKI